VLQLGSYIGGNLHSVFFLHDKEARSLENELGVFMLNKVSKIMFIPPESFYVERK
jgi:hypothetical protein